MTTKSKFGFWGTGIAICVLGGALILQVTCSSGGGPSASVVDENGAVIKTVDTNDPVTLALQGLTPNAQYKIVVKDPSGTELSPSGGFIATADEDGKIPASTILQDIGATTTARLSTQGKAGTRAATTFTAGTTGNYTITVMDASGGTVSTTTFAVANGSKVYCADGTGVGRASFTSAELVYAKITKGDGSLADGTYTCYVVSDNAAVLQDGDPLVGIAHADVTVTSGTGTASLGTFGTGSYDVVCDIDKNGKYTRGTDLIARARRYNACFTIQKANSPADDIVAQICSDRNGNYRDVFDPNATDPSIRDVWAWISPPEKSLGDHHIGVRKYVVAHQTTWTNGDPLVDVTGDKSEAFELDAVQGFCTNESPWLVWPRQRLVAGCYDCIIDVDADGKYTKGIDFVDNIDLTGDPTTCGMRVSDTACADTITLTKPTDGQSVDTTTVAMEGTLAAAGKSGSVTITSGSQSNSFTLDVTGTTIAATIPLYHGDNLITVSVVKADGTMTCTKTVKVTSTATSSAGELFRAQLTWANGNDMDLHVVKPNGTHDTTNDCYYADCKVSSTGGLDWGAEGKASLDVDCIPPSCTNRIENIWLENINQSGVYTVYVYAFSGSGTSVNASIFIRGTQVATVPCGTMVTDSDTRWCKVGTINWSGDSTGGGAFTQIGTLGAAP